jgi:hypothetical protein
MRDIGRLRRQSPDDQQNGETGQSQHHHRPFQFRRRGISPAQQREEGKEIEDRQQFDLSRERRDDILVEGRLRDEAGHSSSQTKVSTTCREPSGRGPAKRRRARGRVMIGHALDRAQSGMMTLM